MSVSRQRQFDSDSARRYEEVAVPLILGPAARALVDWGNPLPGNRILDVGCGTGIAARLSAELVAPDGSVTGIDINEGMIAVAREIAPVIRFHVADATDSGLPDSSFDLVLCAQVLQFLPNKPAAIAEMVRLALPGGRIAVSTWAPPEEVPYFHALVGVIEKYLREDVSAGFALASPAKLGELLSDAGLKDVKMKTVTLDLPLGRLPALIPRHIMTMPIGVAFSAASPMVQSSIVEDMTQQLADYTADDGSTTVPFGVNLASGARKPVSTLQLSA